LVYSASAAFVDCHLTQSLTVEREEYQFFIFQARVNGMKEKN